MRCARAVLERVLADARRAAPAECCGILLGDGLQIVEAVAARNLSSDPNRFVIDPADHIAARRDARARGVDVIGFYHSHPHSAPVPSATDVAEASYAGTLYLIVSLVTEPAGRLFRMNSTGPLELRLDIEPL